MRLLVSLGMMNAQEHGTMYAFFDIRSRGPTLIMFLVFVVPCHLLYCCHVCSDAFDRLVSLKWFSSEISPSKDTYNNAHRNVVSKSPISGPVDPDYDVYIGRSEVAMWMRVVSGWVCIVLYVWSLLAPVLLPDR